MTAPGIDVPTFSCFSSFPPELRSQVWREALPEKDKPAMFIYRLGFWHPLQVTDTDERYDTDNPHLHSYPRFRHDSSKLIRVRTPLVFVNREARNITETWIREQGIIKCLDEDGKHIFARPFDSEQDIVYVESSWWRGFWSEFLTQSPDPKRIAVPEHLILSDHDAILTTYINLRCLVTLYIVVDAPPDLRAEHGCAKVRPRWELETTISKGLSWNASQGGFDLEKGQLPVESDLYKSIEKVNKRFSSRFPHWQPNHGSEIRFALAVKR